MDHTGTCEHCQQQFSRSRRRGPAPRYCSATCRAAAKVVRDRGNGRYAANLARLRDQTKQRQEAEARECPYCGRHAVTCRRVHCGAEDCRRMHKRLYMRQYMRDVKAATGNYPGRSGKPRNPEPSQHRRVPAACRACGAVSYPLKRHLPKDGLTVCGPRCQTYMRTGRWPMSPVSSLHPSRSTRVPEQHACRQKPVWVLTGPRFVGRACRWCGEQFLWDRLPVNGADFEVWHCSARCARRASRAASRLRHGRFAVSDVVRQEIYHRDGWRCRLCGGRVPKGKQVPHPKAATLDHIVPRARGGSDDATNLQIAHYMCNVMKSDGVSDSSGDQLALLG